MSDTNRIHKCHCCGWEWVHGQHGGHDCSIKLQERIKELKGQLAKAETELAEAIDCIEDSGVDWSEIKEIRGKGRL